MDQLLSKDGQLTNFVRQNLAVDYQKAMGIDTLLEQANAEQRIAQQFRHLINDHQALADSLKTLINR